MSTDDTPSFFTLTTQYPDESSAIEYFTKQRWPDGVYCPKCGSLSDVRKGRVTGRRLPRWHCLGCGKQFTVTSGTVMENTKLPLRKWLYAFHMIGGAKKGLSARYLARQLGITLKSAWHLAHRIRATMVNDKGIYSGIVEADEMYSGGRRKHVGKGYRKNKIAVFAVVQRGGGKQLDPRRHHRGDAHVAVKDTKRHFTGQAQIIPLDQEADRVDGRTVGAKLRTHTDPENTILMTDESPIYKKVGESFIEHHRVHHKREDYAHVAKDGHLAHTNTVEGLFANLKRQIHGTHHSTSKKHLKRYTEEHEYKYNTRDESDTSRTEKAIQNMEGKRLTLFKSTSGVGESLLDNKESEPVNSKTLRGRWRVRRPARKQDEE